MTWLINFHPAGVEEFITLPHPRRSALLLRLLQATDDGLHWGFIPESARIPEPFALRQLLCGEVYLEDQPPVTMLLQKSWVDRRLTILVVSLEPPVQMETLCGRLDEKDYCLSFEDFYATLPAAEQAFAMKAFTTERNEKAVQQRIRMAGDTVRTELAELLHYTPLKIQRLERRCDFFFSLLQQKLAVGGCDLSFVVRGPDGVARDYLTFENLLAATSAPLIPSGRGQGEGELTAREGELMFEKFAFYPQNPL